MFTPTSYFQKVAAVLPAIPAEPVEQIIATLRQARANGQRVFVFGNGGSSANASHIVNDMIKSTIQPGRPRMKLICLSDNVPTLTAYANDVGYESVFVEQLKNFAQVGDLVMAISGSGNSPNVLRAVEYANSIGCRTLALTGRDGGKLGPLAQLNIQASEPHMGRIEEVHLTICHMIGYYFIDAEA